MNSDRKQIVLAQLLKKAETQGYVTFDDVMECADKNMLSIQDFDWLTDSITNRGILLYEQTPADGLRIDDSEDDFDDFAQLDYETIYDRIIELAPSLEPFISDVRRIKPAQKGEIHRLKYQVIEGNRFARQRMIEMFLRVAVKMGLQNAEYYGYDVEDAIGDACIGLINAVDRYNPDENGSFQSYAAVWIFQTLNRNLPIRRYHLYYPVHTKEKYYSAYSLLKSKGYINDADIFEWDKAKRIIQTEIGLSYREVMTVLQMFMLDESYEEYFFSNEEENEEAEETVILPEAMKYDFESDVIEQLSQEELLGYIFSILKDKEKDVICKLYGVGFAGQWTLEAIGTEYNVTRERVRQIKEKAFRRLRNNYYIKRLVSKRSMDIVRENGTKKREKKSLDVLVYEDMAYEADNNINESVFEKPDSREISVVHEEEHRDSKDQEKKITNDFVDEIKKNKTITIREITPNKEYKENKPPVPDAGVEKKTEIITPKEQFGEVKSYSDTATELLENLMVAGFKCIDRRRIASIIWVLYAASRKRTFESILSNYSVKYTYERDGCWLTDNEPAWAIFFEED